MRSGVAVIPSLSLLLIWAVYLFIPFKSLELFVVFSAYTHTENNKSFVFLKANKLEEESSDVCFRRENR